MANNIYIKEKTSSSNLETVEIDRTDDHFRVGIREGAEGIIIDYLTNLYHNPATACVRELFTNACDASEDDSEITISITKDNNKDGEKDTYTFTITDFGCGMSADELKNNYVTYAASTKIDDFDSIGSFGLGSKSPMALVPTYVVTSNNGKEQNVCVVSRTDNGIFGKIDKIDTKSDFSFTSVKFSGISEQQARRMNNYINHAIIPFSKIKVNYTCDSFEGDSEPYKFEKQFKIPNASYDITLYTNSDNDIYRCFNSNSFIYLARINNIVYKLLSNGEAGNRDKGKCYIVIDIEPGYFAFNPSREELPESDKLEHIRNIVQKKRWDNYDSFISYVINTNAIKVNDVYEHESKNFYSKISDPNCMIGLSKKKRDKINSFKGYLNGDRDAELDAIKDVELVVYENSHTSYNYYGGKKKSDEAHFKLSYVTKILNQCVSSYSSKFDWNNKPTIIRSFLVTGAKVKRNHAGLNYPSDFRISAVSNALYNEKCRVGLNNDYNHCKYVYIFTANGAELPSDFDVVLENLGNIKYKKREDGSPINDIVPAERVACDWAVKSSASRKIVKIDDRTISYKIDGSYTNYATLSQINLEETFGNPDDVYFCYYNLFNYTFANAVKQITGRSAIYIEDRTKMVRDFFEKNGYEFINFKLNKNEIERQRYTPNKTFEDFMKYFDNCSKLFTSVMNKFNEIGIFDCVKMSNKILNFDTYAFTAKLDDVESISVNYYGNSDYANHIDKLKKYLKIEILQDEKYKIIGNIARYNNAYNGNICAQYIDFGKFIEDNKNSIIMSVFAKNVNSNTFGGYNPAACRMLEVKDTIGEIPLVNDIRDIAGSDVLKSKVNKFVSESEEYNKLVDIVKLYLSNPSIAKYTSIYDKLDENDEVDAMVKNRVNEIVDATKLQIAEASI